MPTLSTSPAPALALTTALAPIAANPIASIGEGQDGGFTAVIATLGGDGLTLDAPPALPQPGTELPPALPGVAGAPRPLTVPCGTPDPLPPIDVEQVMIGTKLPRPIVANMPAPAELPPAAPAPSLPPAAGQAETAEAPAPGAKPMPPRLDLPTPRTDTPKPRVQVAPDRLIPQVRNMPAPADETKAAVAASIDPVARSPVEPLPADVGAEEPATPVEQPAIEIAAPVAIPMPASVPPAPTLPIVAEAPEGSVAAPVVVLPMPASVVSTPPPITSPAPVAEKPLEPASADAKAQPQPTPAATSRADFIIPPELARQVAQIVRPVIASDEPVIDIPAIDFAPLPAAVAAPQPAAASAPASVFQPTPAPSIDVAKAEWMQAMIDRIGDIVREGGRREAQIRLAPDALGTVEVKIVEREDRLQVTLNADTAQARQLLSEHAPRLAELAEARGLRFAQTDIGGGAPQQQDRRPAHDPQTPLRPRSAHAEQDRSAPESGDRIA